MVAFNLFRRSNLFHKKFRMNLNNLQSETAGVYTDKECLVFFKNLEAMDKPIKTCLIIWFCQFHRLFFKFVR